MGSAMLNLFMHSHRSTNSTALPRSPNWVPIPFSQGQKCKLLSGVSERCPFPLLLYVFFALVFGNMEVREDSLEIGLDVGLKELTDSSAAVIEKTLTESTMLQVQWLDREEGKRLLAQNRIHAFVTSNEEEQSEEQYKVVITESNRAFSALFTGVLDRFNLQTIQRVFRGRLPLEYSVEILEYQGRRFTYAYTLFSGVIGVTLLLNCLIAIPQTIIGYRKQGFLKRFSFSPLKKSDFTLSILIHRVGVALLQLLVLTACAALLFKVRLSVAPVGFLATFLLGSMAFSVMGFFVSGVFHEVESAVAAAQVMNIVFIFTAGIFFPLEMMPELLLYITRINPVYYLSNAVYATLALGQGIGAVTKELAVLGGVFVAFFALTLATFRYERKV